MNSDKQSIKNQGGGEPKPYQPKNNKSGSQGGGNNKPTPPKPPGSKGGGGQSPGKPGSGGNIPGKPGSPSSPGKPSPGKPNPEQKGGSSKPEMPGSKPKPPSPGGNDGGQGRGFPPGSGGSPQGSGGGKPSPQGSGGSDAGSPPSEPPQEFSTEDLSGEEEYPPKKSNKTLFVILLIIILALGAAVAVYFLFLSPSDTPAADTSNQQEVEQQQDEKEQTEEEENQAPTVPQATTSETDTEGTTTVPEGEVEEETADGIPRSGYVSLFSTEADSQTDITLDSLNLSSLMEALQFSPNETPLLREVVLVNSNNFLVTSAEVSSMLAPSVFTEEVTNNFHEEPTVFTYSNENGTWLGLAMQLTQNADTESVQSQVAELENNVEELRNFYFSNPGEAGSWSDGGAGDVTGRYITFGEGNAAFNYGWSGNILLIGTSYPAYQEAANRL